jgi:GNAT superfamily N-acetyltransferase
VAALADGYTDVPPGKLAAVVTYLERRHAPEGLPPALPAGCAVRRCVAPPPGDYRAWFRAVGEPWLWFSRLRLDDAALAAVLADPARDVFLLERDAAVVGLLELDRRRPPDVEVAFLGVVPGEVGHGLGRALLGWGLREAWRHAPARVTLHTCTLDHPRALPFYLSMGFTPTHRAIEVADDPRLTGLLPRAAAPHVPLIEPPPQ